MSDYDELIVKLRDDNACVSLKTLHEAADAIEELKERLLAAEWDVTCDPEWREGHAFTDEWGGGE